MTPKDAYEAILKYLEWRDKFDVDSLREDDIDIIKEHEIGRVIMPEQKDTHGRLGGSDQ